MAHAPSLATNVSVFGRDGSERRHLKVILLSSHNYTVGIVRLETFSVCFKRQADHSWALPLTCSVPHTPHDYIIHWFEMPDSALSSNLAAVSHSAAAAEPFGEVSG